jgi:hypothetical protein
MLHLLGSNLWTVDYRYELGTQNAHPGHIVKDSYRRWPERNLTGNAIDFHVLDLGLSFYDTMRHITVSVAP